jgi:hypothetical protein
VNSSHTGSSSDEQRERIDQLARSISGLCHTVIARRLGQFFEVIGEEVEAREAELLRRMTAAMREADETFERVGGSTRHHVRDCLLPVLKKHGLELTLLSDEHDLAGGPK